jgi:hypothetical protein
MLWIPQSSRYCHMLHSPQSRPKEVVNYTSHPLHRQWVSLYCYHCCWHYQLWNHTSQSTSWFIGCYQSTALCYIMQCRQHIQFHLCTILQQFQIYCLQSLKLAASCNGFWIDGWSSIERLLLGSIVRWGKHNFNVAVKSCILWVRNTLINKTNILKFLSHTFLSSCVR